MIRKAPTPDDVFTPRSAEVNQTTYVSRRDLESELAEALPESKNVVIFGESGNGKPWLYKRVFDSEKVVYEIVNLVQTSRLESLNNAFADKISRLEELRKNAYELSKSGEFKPGRIGVSADGVWKYELGKKEPCEDLLAYMHSRSRRGTKKVLILDNFEQVAMDPALCKQVADCIVLLDDSIYSQYEVKLCIVGVPSDIADVLAQHGNLQTISTRLREISEVERMTHNEARALLRAGLENALRIRIDIDPKQFYGDVLRVTDRIALELQEFGLRLAKEALKNREAKIDAAVYRAALRRWAKGSLKTDCLAIQTRLNSKQTKTSRRNQYIFAIGKCEQSDFDYKAIE